MKILIMRCLLAGVIFSFGEYFIRLFMGNPCPFHRSAIIGLGFSVVMFVVQYFATKKK